MPTPSEATTGGDGRAREEYFLTRLIDLLLAIVLVHFVLAVVLLATGSSKALLFWLVPLALLGVIAFLLQAFSNVGGLIILFPTVGILLLMWLTFRFIEHRVARVGALTVLFGAWCSVQVYLLALIDGAKPFWES